MKIGIDCRIYGPKHTGIGRYVQNLVENLLDLDQINEYVLFFGNKSLEEVKNLKLKYSLKIKNLKLKIVFINVNHYSFQEQLFLSRIIKREKVDLMHFPHFNVPVFYQDKFVVTIHDLIKHQSRGRQTSTRSPLFYWFKYLGYKTVFNRSVKRASGIITPSQIVKNQIVDYYKINPQKIEVTYEGVDRKLTSGVLPKKKQEEKNPYFLYVGSVYPHKNIEKLIMAIKMTNKKLVIVCARNVFSDRLNKFIVQQEAGNLIELTGYVSDEKLVDLYCRAKAFIFPTLSEGFGLPGLEAMSLGCPVICSDIPVLKEVYGQAALYFNPYEVKDIARKINDFEEDKSLRETLTKKGFANLQKYSWEKMAISTQKIYLKV